LPSGKFILQVTAFTCNADVYLDVSWKPISWIMLLLFLFRNTWKVWFIGFAEIWRMRFVGVWCFDFVGSWSISLFALVCAGLLFSLAAP
jgi:hypothetical protein